MKRSVAIDHTHEPATKDYNGFFSASDKALIDSLRNDKPAYLTTVTHDTSLSGDGTALSPLGILGVTGEVGKKYKIVACVLRNTAGTWNFIDDTGHAPVGVASVSADSSQIVITYDFTSAKIGALVCTPDETYIADGLSFGASVGDTTATIKAAINKELGGYIFYNGTSWDISLSEGITSVVWDTDKLKINHSTLYQATNYNLSLTGRGGVVNPVISGATGALSEDYVLVDFYDWAGTKITTPNTNMKLFFTRRSEGLVNPLLLTQTSSNIWVYGVFEVA